MLKCGNIFGLCKYINCTNSTNWGCRIDIIGAGWIELDWNIIKINTIEYKTL